MNNNQNGAGQGSSGGQDMDRGQQNQQRGTQDDRDQQDQDRKDRLDRDTSVQGDDRGQR